MENTKEKISQTPGFLLINKPKGINSFRTVAQIRKILGNKKLKAGYAGTLDPFAEGLLVLGIGREATRILHVITRWDKKYIARAKLGELTDTLDLTGQVIETHNSEIEENKLFAAIKRLGKKYKQIPPIYSALKYNGVPLYKLARRKKKPFNDLQKTAETKAKTITLHEITLIKFAPPFFEIEAHVSHGTYIRTLMNDIARNAGSSATTQELRRTTIGQIRIESSIDLDNLKTPDDIQKNLIPIKNFVETYFD